MQVQNLNIPVNSTAFLHQVKVLTYLTKQTIVQDRGFEIPISSVGTTPGYQDSSLGPGNAIPEPCPVLHIFTKLPSNSLLLSVTSLTSSRHYHSQHQGSAHA